MRPEPETRARPRIGRTRTRQDPEPAADSDSPAAPAADCRDAMAARSKLRGKKGQLHHGILLSPVESFFLANVSIGERMRCGDIDRVVM